MTHLRRNGVLMHLTSLPGPYGVGTMGKAAREFVDFLAAAGQSVWQILPICPTSYGDSPYQSYSTFAGNPYLIDLDLLAEEGLLDPAEYRSIDWESREGDVNFGALYAKRYPVLRKAVQRFLQQPPAEFESFCTTQASWLEDYALFMALKDRQGGRSWWDWPEPLRNREAAALRRAETDYRQDVTFWKGLQYLFYRQWAALKRCANDHGISILGDLPIYVSGDSVDVWAHPELFQLDEHKLPREVAGCPPDGFSEVGQLWGNPLFDWDYMARDGYRWWVDRIRYLCREYDLLRIDHFRGFESYYAIPYGSDTAKIGRWRKGPGMDLFRHVTEELGEQPIIAEDLGFLTESVHQLLRDSGYPGMKVLEMGFDSRDPSGTAYLPHNFPVQCVAYAGTHDNDTVQGWMATAPAADVAYAKAYLGLNEQEGYHWGMLRALWSSVAELTVVQAQDLLGLGTESRMNTPSTVGNNWRWRAKDGVFTPELAQRLRTAMELYGRLPDTQT